MLGNGQGSAGLGREGIVAPTGDMINYTDMMLVQVRSAPTNTGWLSVLVTLLVGFLCAGLTVGYYALRTASSPPVSPVIAHAFLVEGNRLYDQGRYDQAIEQYTASIGKLPGDMEAYYRRGLAYKAKGDKPHAISDLRKALELSQDDATRRQIQKELQSLGGG